jgi:hypothetical protein
MTTNQKLYIWNWFDFDNPEHLAAYKYLRETGYWPASFVHYIKDPNVEMGEQWWTMLLERYVSWLEKKVSSLEKEI